MLRDDAIVESLSESRIALPAFRDVNGSTLLELGIFNMAVDSYMKAHAQQHGVEGTIVVGAEVGAGLSRQPIINGVLAAIKSADCKAEVSWFGTVSSTSRVWALHVI